jgi:predicted acyl esterase
VPFKKLWMTQEPHADGSGEGYEALLDAFWDRTLKGVRNGVESRPAVVSRGRSAAGEGAFLSSAAWPPAGTRPLTLHLGRSFDTVGAVPSIGPAGTTGEGGVLRLAPQDSGRGWTHADPGTVTEEVVLRDPTSRGASVGGQPVRAHGYAWLYHETEPLRGPVRLAGSALLKASVNRSSAGQALTPILTEVLPDGTQKLVERGFLNLDYAGGLAAADRRTGDLTATVRFLPQDYTFSKGSRIGLVLMGSNTVWGVPVSAGVLSYDMSGPKATRLVLPVVAAKPSAVLPR